MQNSEYRAARSFVQVAASMATHWRRETIEMRFSSGFAKDAQNSPLGF
jgi:hypothetical protein